MYVYHTEYANPTTKFTGNSLSSITSYPCCVNLCRGQQFNIFIGQSKHPCKKNNHFISGTNNVETLNDWRILIGTSIYHRLLSEAQHNLQLLCLERLLGLHGDTADVTSTALPPCKASNSTVDVYRIPWPSLQFGDG